MSGRQGMVTFLAVVLVISAGNAAAWGDVTEGLFSRYSFDVDARDDVGSNDGTLVGGASIVTDPSRGNVLSLDGTNDYVSLPKDNMASGRSEITVCLWLKADDWASDRMIYDEHGADYGEYWQFSMSEGTWYTRDSSTGPMGSRNNDLSLPSVPVDQWHHLAFVYSASQNVKAIYYDGAPHGSTSNSVDELTTDRTGVKVGGTGDSRNRYFDGMIDELRFYDRALTASEVAILASQETYTLTVNSGSGDGQYAAGAIADISADAAPSGQGFVAWIGDTAGIADVNSPATTLTMPAGDAEVTATYAAAYTLTVNSGSGDGQYGAGAVVSISADGAPSGHVFSQWTGDVGYVANVNEPDTTVTMPAGSVVVTATYTEFSGYYLSVRSGSGDGSYTEGTVVTVTADPPPSGLEFNMWIGDLDGFADVDAKLASPSSYTMPAHHATITADYRPVGGPLNWWPAFDVFCKAKFGAEKEELAYEMFGSTLQLVPAGEWEYASKNSAVVAFQTSLPAKGYVEYGLTTGYGSQTPEPDRYYYTHILYLPDLNGDATYHYRFVAEDERGNVVTSSDRTLTTATPPNVIYVPGSLSGPPYQLNQAGKTYLVTQDLVIDGKAFDVSADNVTLDLGGHTVIYDNVHMGPIAGDFWAYINNSSFGVRAMDVSGLKIYNGTIKQGAGNDAGESSTIGFNPIYTKTSGTMEMAGLTIQYSGPQQCGIYNHWGGNSSSFHHNVFLDTGHEMINRHGAGSRSLLFYGSSSISGVNTYNNLVKRTRQSGLDGNQVHDNEIYADSWTTNSFAVKLPASGVAYNNKVLGTGYHLIGFGWANGMTAYHNFVHLEGQPPDGRFAEFGDQISLNGFRLTQYGGGTKPYVNNLYHDNVVIVTAVGQSECRGVQFFSDTYVENLIFRDNVVKALVRDAQATQAACIVTQGLPDRTESHLPIWYLNNRLISNICNIRFGDYYGSGSNHRFHDCTFVKVGDNPNYKTFRWDSYYASKYHVVRDAVFEGGASLNSIDFHDGDHSMTVEWTLTVQTEPDADVTIKDLGNQQVFSGNSGGDGQVSTPLAQYLAQKSGNVYYTPHAVTVEKGGDSTTESVTVDEKKTVEIYLSTYTLTVDNGSGDGVYSEGQVVSIQADAAPSGQAFNKWTGDTAGISDAGSSSTTLTMPAADTVVTATYRLRGDLDGNGFIGQLDLDIVLDNWGLPVPPADPRADPSGDNFVGQVDLDYVLEDWGQGTAP